jgi:uncharacterized protein YbjT (DUF2867 family)
MILVIGATGLLGMEICRALRQRGKEVRAVDIRGPEPVSQLDAIQIFERPASRDFARQHIADETLQENRRRAADPLELTFAGLMLDYAAGNEADPAELLRIVPLQLTTVGDYAKHAMAARR